MPDRCLVILSGGQDSTTCAAIACQSYQEVHSITFNYNQRHSIELESAAAIAKVLHLASHEIIDLGYILKGASPIVSNNTLGIYDSIDDLPKGVEPTFIPSRNILFLSIAANRAACLDITDIFVGLCQEDFGGYWDCRRSFVDTMELALSQGLNGDSDSIKIHTPLMYLTKADSVRLGKKFLKESFEEVMGLTHTCYAGVKGGCGKCHACHLRDRGFREAGVQDPLWNLRSQESVC